MIHEVIYENRDYLLLTNLQIFSMLSG